MFYFCLSHDCFTTYLNSLFASSTLFTIINRKYFDKRTHTRYLTLVVHIHSISGLNLIINEERIVPDSVSRYWLGGVVSNRCESRCCLHSRSAPCCSSIKKKKKRFWLVSLANSVAVPWGLRFGTFTRTLSKCLMRFNVRTRKRVTKPKFGVKNKSPRYLDS